MPRLQLKPPPFSKVVTPSPDGVLQLQAIECSIFEVRLIVPARHGDARGWFSETWREDWFRSNVADITFVQDNHAFSASSGTLRGLHFQIEPYAQAKLVRCTRGAIWDVAVDIRPDSPTRGQWVGEELTAVNGHQLYVPAGFAHGYLTLEPECEVAYRCSDYYVPTADRGIVWNDRELNIAWPLPASGPILSDKDSKQPTFSDWRALADQIS